MLVYRWFLEKERLLLPFFSAHFWIDIVETQKNPSPFPFQANAPSPDPVRTKWYLQFYFRFVIDVSDYIDILPIKIYAQFKNL